jgi:hypothetical protein
MEPIVFLLAVHRDRRCRKDRGLTVNITRRLSQFALLAITLSGCASAADDGTPPSEASTASDAQALGGAVAPDADAALDADAADCDSAALAPAASAGSYAEFTSILETASVNLDSPEIGGSTCTRVCKCCKNNGNRFCCSHCRFCSGPIGVSGEALAR